MYDASFWGYIWNFTSFSFPTLFILSYFFFFLVLIFYILFYLIFLLIFYFLIRFFSTSWAIEKFSFFVCIQFFINKSFYILMFISKSSLLNPIFYIVNLFFIHLFFFIFTFCLILNVVGTYQVRVRERAQHFCQITHRKRKKN